LIPVPFAVLDTNELRLVPALIGDGLSDQVLICIRNCGQADATAALMRDAPAQGEVVPLRV
jgi:hypothetical protein